MSSLREPILEICFERYQGKFASGKQANNKLDLEKLRTSNLRTAVAAAVTELVEPHKPDMIIPAPNGANWLAIDVAWNLGCAALLIEKNESTKDFNYAPSTPRNVGGLEAVKSAKRIAIVDDAFNEFTNTLKVLALPEIGERAVGAFAIWDRGLPANRPHLPMPERAVITEPIANMLDCSSPLWEYAT